LASTIALTAISVAGILAFLYPFILAEAPRANAANARAEDAPLIFALVLTLTLLLFLVELARNSMNAKTVSMLAVLIVAAAALRIPTLPAGASAFFFLVIVAGYAFGPRLGFLVGSGAMFASAFLIGGFGPWLPFQMYATGWVGMTAGWLASAITVTVRHNRRAEIAVLAVFGAAWGFLFGAIMNLWFWPFVAQGDSISWQPGLGIGETMEHYWSFYLLTSAGWDAWRAIANATLILVAGRATLDLLTRYRDRFQVRFS
jgi:energy-coupling factor transport system substrate-specific component